MKTQSTVTSKANKKKSALITGAIHAALVVLGLIPLTSAIQERAERAEYSIPIEFASFAQSSDEGLQATSEKVVEEMKPVVEEVTEEVSIVEENEAVEEEVRSEVKEVESEVVSEELTEVEASENADEAIVEEVQSDGGQDATSEKGDFQGSDVEGSDEGQNGLDGDGVITRQIIYRENIAEAAIESGVIVVDVCIDRKGRILSIRNNEEKTDIENMAMVRDALDIASTYRFETDYTAALQECGSITFVFDVEGGDTNWETETEAIVANN